MKKDLDLIRRLNNNGSLAEPKKHADIDEGHAVLHYRLFENGGSWTINVRRDEGEYPLREITISDITDDCALAERIFDLLCEGAAQPEHCRDIIEDILS